MAASEQEVHLVLVSRDPDRVYPALTLALGAAALGKKVRLYVTFGGLELVKRDGGHEITAPGLPPAKKFLRDAIEAGIDVCACGPSKEVLAHVFGVTESNLEPGVKFEDVVTFLRDALPAAKDGGVVSFI